MVNVSPLSLRRTSDHACYISSSFVRELSLPNTNGIIPDVSTYIIPFIYPLVNYKSVSDYLKSSPKLGQFHYEVAKSIEYGKPHWHGIFW